MLSALIQFKHSYPAMHENRTTGTPEVCSLRSSRTRRKPSQYSNAHGRL